MTALTDKTDKLWHALKSRELFIWGAGQQGRGMSRTLERNKIQMKGFIDSDRQSQGDTALGHRIHAPEIIGNLIDNKNHPFIIIASMLYDEVIKEQCINYGLNEGDDFILYKNLKPFDYAIDISGACNLRCISCPQADRDNHPPAGFMKAETFYEVLDKILREDPFLGNIQLYQWGEPLLNPQLPEILKIANARGVSSAISSNLSMKCDLAPIIEAIPERFRISISGTGTDYERTHAGGNWEQVLMNLQTLSMLRKKYSPQMKTEVFYHIYKHNQGGPLKEVKNICAKFGFEFHPVWAYIISLDDVLKYLEGGELTAAAKKASDMLEISLEEGMDLARQEIMEPCVVDRCIHINWNLTVSHCMMFFYPDENIAAENFLETPLNKIQASRTRCNLCSRCTAQSLHRYCGVYITKPVEIGEGK